LPAKIIDTAAGGVDDHEFQWKVDTFDDKKFLAQVKDVDTNLSKAGYKTIGVAVCEGNARELENPVWKFAGLLPMLDPPRADTAPTINSLHHANISVKMITGDHVNVGKETARLIGLGTDIHSGEEIRDSPQELKKQLIWEADGFASVLPSDKREAVMTLRNDFGLVVGMTGKLTTIVPLSLLLMLRLLLVVSVCFLLEFFLRVVERRTSSRRRDKNLVLPTSSSSMNCSHFHHIVCLSSSSRLVVSRSSLLVVRCVAPADAFSLTPPPL